MNFNKSQKGKSSPLATQKGPDAPDGYLFAPPPSDLTVHNLTMTFRATSASFADASATAVSAIISA